MPRIRSIKPEFFQDEDLAKLAPDVRLVFVGLWCHADREGRLEDRPGRLKVQIAPYDGTDMEKALAALARAGFITRYSVHSRSYIQVRTFLKHQRPHKTEQPSALPPWENGGTTVVTPLSNGSTTVEERSGMEEGKEKEEGKGKEAEETLTESCPQERTDLPPFAVIWNEEVAGSPLKTVRVWSTGRARALKARLVEEGDLGVWRNAIKHLVASPFHRGVNDRGWIADVDFLLQASQSGKWLDLGRGGPPVAEDVGMTPQLRRLMGGGS